MTSPLINVNSLDIPEIRSRISRFVSVSDAISCVRVSKNWSKDFVFPIWYAVDFKIHSRFEKLDTETTARHGHHIRIIKNLSTSQQLNTVVHPNINNLRVLTMTCDISARNRFLCMDLIYNNNKSLSELTLEMKRDANPKVLADRMISVYSVIPHSSASQLSSIRLCGVSISRTSFTALLRGCPLLTSVDLQYNVALLSGPSIDTFQHAGVVRLVVHVEEVFKPDPESAVSPLGSTLLVHFPNLITWTLYPLQETLIVPLERIIAEVRLCCPQVSKIYTWTTPRALLYDFIASVFHNLQSVRFAYEQLSMDIILALLFHKATLLDISTIWNNAESDIERDQIPVQDDHFRTSGRTLQLLPRSCQNLAILRLEHHEMDMDWVEEDEWACKNLCHLRVRVRGLDTAEKIDTTLKLWMEGKQNNSRIMEVETSHDEDMSIETRVARHLLMFEDLREVWLGTRTCYATSG